jgi:hypothetical protein
MNPREAIGRETKRRLTKQTREIPDSVIQMISITYDQRAKPIVSLGETILSLLRGFALSSGSPQRVAQRSTQAAEIVGARKPVRASS